MVLEGNYIGFNFAGRNLSNFVLKGNFTGADFTGASLTNADLRGGKFVGADFTRANLRGAKLPIGFERQVDNPVELSLPDAANVDNAG